MPMLPLAGPDGLLDQIEAALSQSREVVLTRGDTPVARVLPMPSPRAVPSRAALRESMPRLPVASETHVRADRDAR